MSNTLKKLWNDPVWSKVIAGVILPGLAFAWGKWTASGSKVLGIRVPLWLAIVAAVAVIVSRWLVFSIVRFSKNRAKKIDDTNAVASLGKISFEYLPHESPLNHGWKLGQEPTKTPPTLSSLPANAPVAVGLSVQSNGWYSLDYDITEAQITKCNRLIFAAKFGGDGVIYTFLKLPSTVVGGTSEEKWIQFGINIGPTRLDEKWNEGVVELIGKQLRDGWMTFDVSLDDAVARTFGKRNLIYGSYAKLLKIRFRGSLSISEVEFYRG
jgi:hypothetical protein